MLIDQFGGSKGVCDQGALEAAVNRPYMTFNQQELYPSPVDKSAAIIESIVKNHPFIDGNKRTGYVLMRLILLQTGLDIKADQEEKYAFVIRISKGAMDINTIKDWIKKRMKKRT